MRVAEALRNTARRLESVSDTARLDAELLMAEALGVARSELLLRHMQEPCPEGLAPLIERRLGHEPVAYILGRQAFYGRDFVVGPGVLIPRSDSEALIDAALAACPAPRRVLDCGVGSGALLLTILAERRGAEGVGIDRSPKTLKIAARNAALYGEGRATLVEADWRTDGWSEGLGRFDLILANPPYVEEEAPLAPSVRNWEPAEALFAGPDGLDDYRVLVPQLPRLLEGGGRAVLEIGPSQAAAVDAIASAAGLTTRIVRDLAGRPRALVVAFRGWQSRGK